MEACATLKAGGEPSLSLATPYIMEYRMRQGLLWLGYFDRLDDLDEVTAQAFMLISQLTAKEGAGAHGSKLR